MSHIMAEYSDKKANKTSRPFYRGGIIQYSVNDEASAGNQSVEYGAIKQEIRR